MQQAPSPPAPQEIERAVEEILRRSEFQGDPLSNWVQDMVSSILETLASLNAWTQANPTGRWILLVVLTVALVALLTHMGWTIWRILPKRDSRRLHQAGTPWKTLEGQAASWREALELARRALARSDFYSAVWVSHRLLLGVLDERGMLRFARWKTNRDYLRECSDQGEGRRLLGDLSKAFDQIVYAHRPATEGQLQGLLNRVDEFYRQSGQGPSDR